MDNYDLLYDKDGNSNNLQEGNLGSWILSTHMYQNSDGQNKKTSIQLVFNRNIRKCRGYFTINEINYPVFYENSKIALIDQNTDPQIKHELVYFKLLFQVLKLDKTYLQTLESKKLFLS